MAKRRTKNERTFPEHWRVSTETTINGRRVTPGTELSIRGVRGRFRFVQYVEVEGGRSWVDVIGGPANYKLQRSFGVEQVKTVHRIAKTRENSAA
jgi:hypothetical protein